MTDKRWRIELTESPRHDTPHPLVPNAWWTHCSISAHEPGNLDTAYCTHCGAPHRHTTDGLGRYLFVATEARECPETFDDDCDDCGWGYGHAEGCTELARIMDNVVDATPPFPLSPFWQSAWTSLVLIRHRPWQAPSIAAGWFVGLAAFRLWPWIKENGWDLMVVAIAVVVLLTLSTLL